MVYIRESLFLLFLAFSSTLSLFSQEMDYHTGFGLSCNSISFSEEDFIPFLDLYGGAGLSLTDSFSLGLEYSFNYFGIIIAGYLFSSPAVYGKWCINDLLNLTAFAGICTRYKISFWTPGAMDSDFDDLVLTDYTAGIRLTLYYFYAEVTLSPNMEFYNASLGFSYNCQAESFSEKEKARKREERLQAIRENRN